MIHPATNPVIAARAGALKTACAKSSPKSRYASPTPSAPSVPTTDHNADHASHSPEEVQAHTLGYKPHHGPGQS